MNKNVLNADRILLRVVVAVAGLCAATFHWWLLPLVLVAGELGSRALQAHFSRPTTNAEPKKRSVTVNESAEATDEYAVPNPAELPSRNDYYTDPLYHRLPSNIWRNKLN